MLMSHQLRQHPVHPPYTRLYPFTSNLHPHRQRVVEQPHHSVRSLSPLRPPKQHRPKHHILSPTYRPQHPAPCHMTQTCRAHSQLPRTLPHPSRQLHFQLESCFLDPTAVSSHLHQPKRRRRLLHIPQHLPKKCLVLLATHPQSRLRYQIPKRQRLPQTILLPQQIRLCLFLHHLQRRMIHHQVMHQLHHQPPLLFPVIRHIQPQQRRLPHIDPVSARIKSRVQLLTRISSLLDCKSLHPHTRLSPHHLHRLPQPFPHHTRPQYVMPIHYPLQRLYITVQPLPIYKTQLPHQQVRVPLLPHQVMKQNPFLQRRQRINVLHIPCPTWHHTHYPIDLFLTQLH